MHFWSLQSYSSTESNTHTHTTHTHTQTHAHTLTQIHTLTHIHTHTQHTNTPYGRSSERVRKMASQTSQTMQLIGCGDGKGKGKGRTIHTKDIEIYVAASPSETKIGAMNWSRSNTTAHAIFWRKPLTCLFKDSSVGFCNTESCDEIENMHILYVWCSQFSWLKTTHFTTATYARAGQTCILNQLFAEKACTHRCMQMINYS